VILEIKCGVYKLINRKETKIMRPLFFVEGNDGLGKTHFLKELMRKLSDMRIYNVIYISKPTGFITKNYKDILPNKFNHRRYLDKIKSEIVKKEDKFNYLQAMNKNIDSYISLLRRDYLVLLDRTNLSNEIYNDDNYIDIFDEFDNKDNVYGMFFKCPNILTGDFIVDPQEYNVDYLRKIEVRYNKYYRNHLSNNKNIGLIEVIDNNVNNVKVIKDSIDLFLDEVEKDNLAYNYLGV
jgi:hypothetical protein